MKLKCFGLLAMLGLLMWSCSDDSGIKSGEGKGMIKAELKANYNVKPSMKANDGAAAEVEAVSPEITDFAVRLTKTDGSYDKTWATVAEFPVDTKFSTGIYTMEISYGNIAEEGFEKPYYFGSGKFEVIDEETVTPTIEAKLGNSMVTLSYTEAFKNYFTDYSAKVCTANGSVIEYGSEETRPVYVKPGKVSFVLTMTKTNGVELSLEPTAIDNAAACTHYRVTFDVNGGEVGDAVLSVSFDDATVATPIEVLLSEELLNAPAPVINTKGFENNVAINIIEGDEADASVVLAAQSGIASVTLGTSSEYLLANGWQAEMELVNATAEQKAILQQYGLGVKGLWINLDKMAVVDFSGLIPNLKPTGSNSTHTFTLQVADIYGRVAETAATLVVNAPAVTFEMSEAQKSESGSREAKFKLAYNGNMDNVTFKARNDYGMLEDAAIKSCVDNGDGSYLLTVVIPDNATATTVVGYYKGEEKSSVEVKIGMAFSLSANDYDVWATKAIVKMTSKTPEKVRNNLKSVYVNDVATTNYAVDATNNTFTITGLSAGTQHTIKIVADDEGDDCTSSIQITTEAAAQVSNGDMENWQAVKLGEFGLFSKSSYYDFYPYAEGESDIWWATNNPRSQDYTVSRVDVTSSPCVSYTTDVHGGSKAALIYTSGHGGKGADTGAGSLSVIYPANSFAGSLWIGSYSYSSAPGEETHGHSFSSRPSSLSFWYKYAPKNSDSFKVWVAVKNGDTILAEGTFVPTAYSTADTEYKQATINLNYVVTNKKATTICVQFLSTTKTSFSTSDFDKHTSITFPVMGSWKAHIGSILKFDDIVLNY